MQKVVLFQLTFHVISNISIDENILTDTKTSVSQKLKDTDGDGYFPIYLTSDTHEGSFSLLNYGSSRVEVLMYQTSTGVPIWNTRVNGINNNTPTSAISVPLSLPVDTYYFQVVSDDGSPLNVECTASY